MYFRFLTHQREPEIEVVKDHMRSWLKSQIFYCILDLDLIFPKCASDLTGEAQVFLKHGSFLDYPAQLHNVFSPNPLSCR